MYEEYMVNKAKEKLVVEAMVLDSNRKVIISLISHGRRYGPSRRSKGCLLGCAMMLRVGRALGMGRGVGGSVGMRRIRRFVTV